MLHAIHRRTKSCLRTMSKVKRAEAWPRPGGLDYRRAVEEFCQPIYRFAFGLTASESDATDLTKETYETLLAKGERIRDLQMLKSWLFTTLYRKFLSQRRRQIRKLTSWSLAALRQMSLKIGAARRAFPRRRALPRRDAETVARRHPAVESGTERRTDAVAVITALQTLDEECRAPLVLFYLEEFSNREIASILGVPIDMFLSRIARGKDILRKQFEAAESGGVARQSENAARPGQPDSLVRNGAHR